MINLGGPTLIARIADQTGRTAPEIAAAFAAVRDAYSLTAFNADIDALDGRISGARQLALYGAVQTLLIDRIIWFLRNADFAPGLATVIAHYRDGIAAVDEPARAHSCSRHRACGGQGRPGDHGTRGGLFRRRRALPDPRDQRGGARDPGHRLL
jgi:glutamate dehydrogenase